MRKPDTKTFGLTKATHFTDDLTLINLLCSNR